MWVAVLLCVIGAVTGSPLSPPEYDAIVVGLGPAGTIAAATLADAGRRVLALEAMDRVGGRVHTVTFGDDIVEVGAEWIHGTENSRSYELAIQNNVTILPQFEDFSIYRSDGSVADTAVLDDLMTFSLSVIDEPPENPEPVGKYVTRRLQEHVKTKYPQLYNDKDFMDNLLQFMDLVIDTYDASNSWNDISTKSAYVELKGNQQMSWHKNGYKTLFEILLKKYKNGPGLPKLTIKLKTEVVQIKWPKESTGPVEVTIKDGTVYKAEQVIVTVSVGVLKDRYATLFTPAIPETKAKAIDVIGFGVVAKVIFRFPYKWCPNHFCGFLWRNAEREAVTKEDEWVTKSDGATVPMSCETCVTVWFSGDSAKLVEILPEDVLQSKLMTVIKQFMGNIVVPEPTAMIRSSWFKNPFTRGSYSYESIPAERYPDARKDLGVPLTDGAGVPRVLFAGEATALTSFSCVHGALDSGVREANRVLQLNNA